MADFTQTPAYRQGWPLQKDMPETLKHIESMSKYMEWAHKTVKGKDLKAFCCVGEGIDKRNEVDCRYVLVWAPQLAPNRVQKVWTVTGLDNQLMANPESFPFYFSVDEIPHGKGKTFFNIGYIEIDLEEVAQYPEHVIYHIEESNNPIKKTVNNSLHSSSSSSSEEPRQKKRKL